MSLSSFFPSTAFEARSIREENRRKHARDMEAALRNIIDIATSKERYDTELEWDLDLTLACLKGKRVLGS